MTPWRGRGAATAETMLPSSALICAMRNFSYRLPGKNIVPPSERQHADRPLDRVGEIRRGERLPKTRRVRRHRLGDLSRVLRQDLDLGVVEAVQLDVDLGLQRIEHVTE